MKKKIQKLFQDWNDTLIWSCLQGKMGVIIITEDEKSAMAMLGDFVFFTGKPCVDLVTTRPDFCERDFMIMIPQNEEWAKLIEYSYGDQAKKVTRYATKKEPDVFDVEKLQKVVSSLPEGYELKLIEAEEFQLCKDNGWANDLVSQYSDYSKYKELGLGVAVFYQGELVAGASSYSVYDKGIEIEIDTREDYRRKGLAYACGAKLILECLERGLYPSWDAQNPWSLALAEKLGYHFSHEYVAYEVRIS